MKIVIGVLAIVGLYGCGSSCLQVKATRCVGDEIQICCSNKKWQHVMFCDKVQPIYLDMPKSWMCGQLDSRHTCVPKVSK